MNNKLRRAGVSGWVFIHSFRPFL